MMNNENDNVMNGEQNPASEEMDFVAAGKEARRITGSDVGEWENRSSGTRSRGPSGRSSGLYGRKGKTPVREEDLAGLLKKDAGASDSELLRALTLDAQPEEEKTGAEPSAAADTEGAPAVEEHAKRALKEGIEIGDVKTDDTDGEDPR